MYLSMVEEINNETATLFLVAKPSPLGFRPPKSGRSISKFTGYPHAGST